jgi:hypothetical protein
MQTIAATFLVVLALAAAEQSPVTKVVELIEELCSASRPLLTQKNLK